MITSFLLLLLPAAAASGWYAAKRNTQMLSPKEGDQFVHDYLIGLNYLLNEQPDKAVDTFIKMLEIDNETVETHLALGALFRRRGEVDRAIRIHQNLIARPQLPKRQRMGALLALGQDYLKAGMLDRAERLFLEVVETDNEFKAVSPRYLLDIYQQQKRWESAIAIANKLIVNGEPMQSNIAHYYCELSIETGINGKLEQVPYYLKHALEIDSNCVRASLLLGDYEIKVGNFEAALLAYHRVKYQDADYLAEAIVPLTICYEQLNRPVELIEYLHVCLQEYPRVFIVLALTDRIRFGHGINAATEFLTNQLRQNPSIRGLQRLITLQLETAEDKARGNLIILRDAILRLLKNKSLYHCIHCGFNSKVLHWLCPGCKNWGTIKPVLGLEGEYIL